MVSLTTFTAEKKLSTKHYARIVW